MTCPYKAQIMMKNIDWFVSVTWSIMLSIFLHDIQVAKLSLFKAQES
jgi:hypothetical protein